MSRATTAADRIVKEIRTVDDPMKTDAQLVYERRQRPGKIVGKVEAEGNALTRIGGLAYIRKRLSHHERAAERFKSMYERLYGAGMPAVDAGRVQVDSSIVAHDAGMALRLDSGREMDALRKLLGAGYDLLVGCVVLGSPCEDMAEVMPSGEPNRRHVAQCVDRVLDALDELAGRWGYAMGQA